MRFPNEISFDDLLIYIKQATATPTYAGIPSYVTPYKHEVYLALNPTFQIDLEGVPLPTTLRLCLKQLGREYRVQDGYLRIINEDDDEVSSPIEDPFLIVGHCLLALIATAIGGVFAPLAAERRERPGRRGIANASAIGRASEDQAGHSAGAK